MVEDNVCTKWVPLIYHTIVGVGGLDATSHDEWKGIYSELRCEHRRCGINNHHVLMVHHSVSCALRVRALLLRLTMLIVDTRLNDRIRSIHRKESHLCQFFSYTWHLRGNDTGIVEIEV